MLQLDVARLKKSVGDFARYELLAELPPLEMPGERLFFTSPAAASLVVYNSSSALAVEGKVSGGLRLTCSRCLEAFDYPYEILFEETYTQKAGDGREESVYFSGDIIDVTPEVLKSIIFALPMKPVCHEECPGLCPNCGINPNTGSCSCSLEDVDPRMSILKGFFKDKE